MKIGIYSSSTPLGKRYPKRTNRAIEFLTLKGNEVIEGKLLRKEDSYRTGTSIERGNEINDLVNQNVDVLMASVGGSNTSSVLPYIDFDSLNQKTKIVCGYSDSTALLTAVIRKSPNVRVFYGPALIPSFGDFEDYCREITYDSFINAINKPNYEYQTPVKWTDDRKNWEEYESEKNFHKNEWFFINSKETITGRVIGGNLNTILGTWNSEYGLEIKSGDILLIEDSCKDAETVEKNFNFLKLNKAFDKVSAIILGKHEQFNDQNSNKKPIDILLELMDDKKIPIVYDVDFSHCKPMLIVELNKPLTIDFKNKKIYK
ncbi:S66 family peptidase [Mesoplasma lactucae]|uniref:LD-carboxypeptidase n=1 Tax=Mesoplasma lactucae ATCC 49193 TaxID=81460 RepID=A0A291IS23_9MOLU|nr:S66 peptidase family protein [Mesoplasma lactucae]ATG97599.1 LD-carboxypeptidase [Mesoplasma lactucae ATCC 49193]ATZ19941.1 hypothetical protein MLACT_v1c01190 [Mesoplasma lactucae ATCC 49193]MCL8217108.1 Microcin C7 self-immunity protein MccF [Mesoplasma lactucae ATCC 49193]